MRLLALERRILVLSLAVSLLGGAISVAFGVCGPFTDVTDAGFCPFVLEIFTLGITTGTTPTTYDPTASVSRLQMAAFLSRTVDGLLKRGSRRAALDQFWTPQNPSVLGLTTVGIGPTLLRFDGADVWASVFSGASVSRVRANDGKLLATWTGATNAYGVLVAMGRVFATGLVNPGRLYRIDPSQAAGAVTTVASNVGINSTGIAFDGSRIWTANFGQPAGSGGSVSIVTPGTTLPWTVMTVTTGFQSPFDALFDGTNIWVTDNAAGTLLKVDSNGAILQTVTVSPGPVFAVFDGGNIWVPSSSTNPTPSNAVTVVRASSGVVLATLTGNGLDGASAAAFDGERILVTNNTGDSVSLWKAGDLTPLGSFSTGSFTAPIGACSDGLNFWVGLNAGFTLARF